MTAHSADTTSTTDGYDDDIARIERALGKLHPYHEKWFAVSSWNNGDPIETDDGSPISVITTGDFPEDNIIETLGEQHAEMAEYLAAVQPATIKPLIELLVRCQADIHSLARRVMGAEEEAKTLRAEANRLGTQVAHMSRERNELATKLVNTTSRYQSCAYQLDQARVGQETMIKARDSLHAHVVTLDEKVDALRLENATLRRENEALVAAGAALEREMNSAVVTEPRRDPIEPWGLVADDDDDEDDDEQGEPISPWPDPLPKTLMEVFAEEARKPYSTPTITELDLTQAREYGRQQAEWFRENPPKLKFDPEPIYRPTYEHKVTGWISEDEFRSRLREPGEWKLISHHMDLADGTHYCVFERTT